MNEVTISFETFMNILHIIALIILVLTIICFKDKKLEHSEKMYILKGDIVFIIIYGIFNLVNSDLDGKTKMYIILNIVHYVSLVVAIVPFIYNIVTFINCKQTVFAKCIDVKEHTTPSNDEDNPHDYHVTTTFKYKYEFNGKKYYFTTEKSKKRYLENTYSNDNSGIFDSSTIEINTFTDEYGSSLSRNQVNNRYNMNIKINPNNPNQRRLKDDWIGYILISVIGVAIFVVTKMLLRYL